MSDYSRMSLRVRLIVFLSGIVIHCQSTLIGQASAVPQNRDEMELSTHRAFATSNESPDCMIDGVRYETSFDCAVGRARLWSKQVHGSAVVELESGVNETKVGLQMSFSGGQTISIRGNGKGVFAGGSTLKIVSALTTAVISYPYLAPEQSSGYWSDLHLESFTIDANGKAPMCMDLYALRVAHLQDLSCSGATGARTWVRIGGYGSDIGGTVPKGMQGLAFQVIASDIFIYNNTAGPGADVIARVENGRIGGFSLQQSGQYRQPSTAPVLLKGARAGSRVCDVMPQGLEAHLIEDPAQPGMRKLASITSQTSGSGCAPDLHVAVPDMPPALYGIEIAATDSTFYDLTDDSVGISAGIVDRGSDGSVFYHPHAWNVRTMFEAWGHESIVDPEIDSVYQFGVRVRYGDSTVITRPAFIYVKHKAFEAAGDFFFDEGTSNTRIVDPVCLNLDLNEGYAQLSGPISQSYKAGGFVSPWTSHEKFQSGLQLAHNRSCRPVRKLDNGVTAQTFSFAEGEASGRRISFFVQNRKTTPATPLLVAVLPPAAAEHTMSARFELQGGRFGEMPVEVQATLVNSAVLPFRWKLSGPQRQLSCAHLIAYRQEDGRIDVYAALAGNSSATINVDMVQSPDILLAQEATQAVPTGKLMFDSGLPSVFPFQQPHDCCGRQLP